MAPQDRKAWDDYAKALIRSRRASEALAAAMRLAEMDPASWPVQIEGDCFSAKAIGGPDSAPGALSSG